MAYTALLIAKYLIKKSHESGQEENKITNLKLQKLLYYAQGWYLANFTNPLFEDMIEAWKYGPAIRKVYQVYKDYGNQGIDEIISPEEMDLIDETTKDFLDQIWDTYKKYSGVELAYATHRENPWINAYYQNPEEDFLPSNEISKDAMLSYFRSLINGS